MEFSISNTCALPYINSHVPLWAILLCHCLYYLLLLNKDKINPGDENGNLLFSWLQNILEMHTRGVLGSQCAQLTVGLTAKSLEAYRESKLGFYSGCNSVDQCPSTLIEEYSSLKLTWSLHSNAKVAGCSLSLLGCWKIRSNP